MAEAIDRQEIRYLGDLARLQLKPGDKLVLTCQEYLSDETYARLKSCLEEWAPGVLVLVLGPGMTLGAVGVSVDG